MAATIDTKTIVDEEKLRSVFSVFDTAKKGAFSAENMRFGFEKIGILVSLEKAQEIMSLHGIGPKENLSYENFREIIAPNMASAPTVLTQVSATHLSLDKT
jgi:Ca2+-binding EF-hand superfamily protein